MIKEIRIPEISENVKSGKVVEVRVKTGDEVEVDDPIIEFETEKAVVEIPTPFKGRITEILVREGDELKVGDVIAKIETEVGEPRRDSQEEKRMERARKAESAAAEAESAIQNKALQEKAAAQEKPEREEKAEADAGQRPVAGGLKTEIEMREDPQIRDVEKRRPPADVDAEKWAPAPASPSVRRFARELGVDIHAVKTAGPGDRITEADVKTYLKQGRPAENLGAAAAPGVGLARQPALPDFSRWGAVEIRELSSVRRLTAEAMAASWHTVVHVTQFDRADITSVLEFMRRNAESVVDRGGKLTLTAVLAKICAAALRRFPQFNASIDAAKQQLILKKYIHIGVAVDTPRGLLVPVARNADRKTILELAVEIVDLAQRARDKKIRPDEMEGGSFTISNQGGIGGTNFTPVVFWPQAAILGVSRASTEPRYIGGELQPREVLPLALSYDHRIVDGADAARFLGWIRESLEHPLTLHLD